MAFEENQKRGIIIIFMLILISLVGYMLSSYLGAIVVGGLIAYFLFPVQEWLRKKLKSPNRARIVLVVGSTIAILLFLLVFIVPLVSETQGLYKHSGSLVTNFLKEIQACPAEDPSVTCQFIEMAEGVFGKDFIMEKGKELLEGTSLFIFEGLRGIINRAIALVVFVFIMVFSIFYFLEHGESILARVMEIIPLNSRHKNKILDRLKDTLDAVVGGNFITSILQGIIGGLIFFFLGIPSPMFWGLLMAILAFIPLVGPSLIWIPAAIILLISGSTIEAIILAVLCGAIFTMIDGFLKPKLIGQKIQLSTFAIFLGVIGGLKFFGIMGLFFGPIIIALLVTSIDIYREMIE